MANQTIAVIDYGMGNLRSVAHALEHVAGRARVVVTNDKAAIAAADRVVFPGQGAARDCMQQLRDHDVIESIVLAYREKPFLGICMGLQVLLDRSDENGGIDCLGLVAGGVHGFATDMKDSESGARLSVPQMGWNQLEPRGRPKLLAGLEEHPYVYFAHSYYVPVEAAGERTAAYSVYGVRYTSALESDNVYGVQFHPEKSGAAGQRIMRNFLEC